jgi:hypothetical protein
MRKQPDVRRSSEQRDERIVNSVHQPVVEVAPTEQIDCIAFSRHATRKSGRGLPNGEHDHEDQSQGTQKWLEALPEHFSGKARLIPLFEAAAPGRAGGALVSFEPRARNDWHTHPLGRTLIVTERKGLHRVWGGPLEFYQAFGPVVAAEYLGTASPLLAPTVFASVMVLNPLGGSAAGRLERATAVRLGMGAFVVAVVGVVVSLRAGASMPFIAASLVVGAAQGLATTAGLRALLAASNADERAGCSGRSTSSATPAVPSRESSQEGSRAGSTSSRSRSATPFSARLPPRSR